MNGQPAEPSSLTTLHRLCTNLELVEEQIKTLIAEQRRIRAEIERIAYQLGGTVEVDGFGVVELVHPPMVVAYNRKAIEELIVELVERGLVETARAIVACKREYPRSATLRITRTAHTGGDSST